MKIIVSQTVSEKAPRELIQLKAVIKEMSQIAKFMEPTWDPPGSCRPQMGSMLGPWTLLSGVFYDRYRLNLV